MLFCLWVRPNNTANCCNKKTGHHHDFKRKKMIKRNRNIKLAALQGSLRFETQQQPLCHEQQHEFSPVTQLTLPHPRHSRRALGPNQSTPLSPPIPPRGNFPSEYQCQQTPYPPRQFMFPPRDAISTKILIHPGARTPQFAVPRWRNLLLLQHKVYASH